MAVQADPLERQPSLLEASNEANASDVRGRERRAVIGSTKDLEFDQSVDEAGIDARPLRQRFARELTHGPES